jgi:hypothetical protein
VFRLWKKDSISHGTSNVVILFVPDVIGTHNCGLGKYMISFKNRYHFLIFVVGIYLSTSRTMFILLVLDFLPNSSPIKKITIPYRLKS